MRAGLFAFALLVTPGLLWAQDDQTLADIRQELTVLNVEVQKLRRELSTTGTASVSVTGTSVLDRVSSMEAELQRLTAKTEQLEFRIGQVVQDGTNRIGDLEFRLVELEGGDVSALGETSTLGGDAQAAAPQVAAPTAPDTTQLAVGEEQDFKRAQDALASKDYAQAAQLFAAFNETYPGGPLSAGADFGRGEALEGLGNTRDAARAYLNSFSADPQGTVAPAALFRVGRALGELGQVEDACVTLREVGVRFPQSEAAQQANAQISALGCT